MHVATHETPAIGPSRPGQLTFLRVQRGNTPASSERRAGSLIITFVGDLDLVTSAQLDEHLAKTWQEASWIILDVAGVDLHGHQRPRRDRQSLEKAVAAGGTLVLAGARYQYTKALWITGLASRLSMYDTVDEAVAAGADPQANTGPPQPPPS